MAGYITLKIKADEAQAVTAFQRLTAAQQQAVLASMKLATQSNRTDRTLKKIGRSARDIAGALGMGIGIGAAMTKVVELTRQWFVGLDRIAEKGREAGREMTAIAMMQEGGQVRGRVLGAAKVGARYGVGMGDAWGTTQAFQAKLGSYRAGLTAAGSAFGLAQQANVPLQGARKAVSVGMGLGLTAPQAARAAYAAGEASQLSPAELADMAGPGLPPYMGVGGGAVTGYGVAAALSGLISDPGMLGTYTRQVGTLMQSRSGAVGKTWKRLGFAKPGAQPIAQLQALKGAGIDTMGGLQAAGFAKKESMGLAILLADLDQSLRTMEAVRTKFGDVGIMGRRRGVAEAEMPEMVYQREAGRLGQEFQFAQTFGPSGPEARERDLSQRRRGVRAANAGYGWVADDEGRVGGWGTLIWSLLSNPASGGGPGQGMRLPAQDLTEALRENTEAHRRETHGRNAGVE